ncbi:MAG: heavy metal-responsive transcriptional regulator [Euzebya sp.]
MQVLIGQLAATTGVPAKTLRFWEDEGLLQPPSRTSAGYRDYASPAVDRVHFILSAQAAGLTLRQIGEIIAIHDAGSPPCPHAATLVADRLSDIETRLLELTQARQNLQAVQRRLQLLDPADCDSSVICSAIVPATRRGSVAWQSGKAS